MGQSLAVQLQPSNDDPALRLKSSIKGKIGSRASIDFECGPNVTDFSVVVE